MKRLQTVLLSCGGVVLGGLLMATLSQPAVAQSLPRLLIFGRTATGVNTPILVGTDGTVVSTGAGGGAPSNATYITQTANGSLSAEQALGALSSGILRSATTTGVVTSLGDILPGANGGTANGFFAVSGPTTSLKTFAFPNTSATVLTTNTDVTLAQIVPASGASVLLGRGSASGGGDFQEVTLGSGLTMTNQVLSASGGGSIGGSATNTYVAVGSGTDTITGSSALTFDVMTGTLTLDALVATGANVLTLAGASMGNPVTLTVSGADANVGMILAPKVTDSTVGVRIGDLTMNGITILPSLTGNLEVVIGAYVDQPDTDVQLTLASGGGSGSVNFADQISGQAVTNHGFAALIFAITPLAVVQGTATDTPADYLIPQSGAIRLQDSSDGSGEMGGIWGYDDNYSGDMALLRVTLNGDTYPQITIGDDDFGRVDFNVYDTGDMAYGVVPSAAFPFGTMGQPWGPAFFGEVTASNFVGTIAGFTINQDVSTGGGPTFAGSVTASDFLVGSTSIVPLQGTTSSIGGGLLAAAGSCATGTASVTGAVAGMPVVASTSDGSAISGLVTPYASVTANGTVTVQLCAVAAVTPAAKTWTVRVIE